MKKVGARPVAALIANAGHGLGKGFLDQDFDGYADRQDLKVSLLKIARREGCRVSLGTDAHHPYQLAYIDLALAAALQAKIPTERVLNFMSRDELLSWVEGHK